MSGGGQTALPMTSTASNEVPYQDPKQCAPSAWNIGLFFEALGSASKRTGAIGATTSFFFSIRYLVLVCGNNRRIIYLVE